jgi:hypothetical protein
VLIAQIDQALLNCNMIQDKIRDETEEFIRIEEETVVEETSAVEEVVSVAEKSL